MPRLPTICALVLLTAGLSGCAAYDYDYYDDEDCGPVGERIVYEEVDYGPPPRRYHSGYHHPRRHYGHRHHHDHGYSHGHGGRGHGYHGPHGGHRGGRY